MQHLYDEILMVQVLHGLYLSVHRDSEECATLFWTMAPVFLYGSLHFLYQWNQEGTLYILFT